MKLFLVGSVIILGVVFMSAMAAVVDAIDRNTAVIKVQAQEQAHRTLQLSIITACGKRGGSLEPDETSGGSDRIKCY